MLLRRIITTQQLYKIAALELAKKIKACQRHFCIAYECILRVLYELCIHIQTLRFITSTYVYPWCFVLIFSKVNYQKSTKSFPANTCIVDEPFYKSLSTIIFYSLYLLPIVSIIFFFLCFCWTWFFTMQNINISCFLLIIFRLIRIDMYFAQSFSMFLLIKP